MKSAAVEITLSSSNHLFRERVRALICDTDRMNGQLMAAALRRTRGFFDTIEPAATIQEAADNAIRTKPHVALVSADFNGDSAGFQLLQLLREFHPETKPIMLLRSGERDAVVRSFRAGARGIVYRTDSFKTLVKCIRSVHRGQIWASTQDIEFLVQELVRPNAVRIDHGEGLALLTQREMDVTRLVADGMRNREIAEALHVTEHTVCNYLYRIFDKLGLSSRVELILYALSRVSSGSSPDDAFALAEADSEGRIGVA